MKFSLIINFLIELNNRRYNLKRFLILVAVLAAIGLSILSAYVLTMAERDKAVIELTKEVKSLKDSIKVLNNEN